MVMVMMMPRVRVMVLSVMMLSVMMLFRDLQKDRAIDRQSDCTSP
jgi:hypothetical protein